MTNVGGAIAPIENYLPELESAFEKHNVVLAYLYGSQVRGNASPLSDVDIAVLFRRDLDASERFRSLLDLMSDLATIFQRDDVNVLDLDESAPLLNNNVRLYGRVIFCSDEKAHADFMLHALQQYVDTEPMRREQNYYLREKIKRGLFGRPIPVMPQR